MKTKPKPPGTSVPVIARNMGVIDLFKGMDEWTDRIAKRAYELFQQHGSSDGHALEQFRQPDLPIKILGPIRLCRLDEFKVNSTKQGLFRPSALRMKKLAEPNFINSVTANLVGSIVDDPPYEAEGNLLFVTC